MTVEELEPGLWRWTAFRPEWRQEVGCVSVDTDDGLVLIDPLVPQEPADEKRFFAALDRDVARHGGGGGGPHVLVTIYYHVRSAEHLVRRYRARLWASRRARGPIARRAGEPSDLFRPGDPLPGGIQALESGRGTEVLYWLPDRRTLVVGDAILGGATGKGLRLCPASWLPAGSTHETMRERLAPLRDLPVRRVLVSHGEPVRERGRAALAKIL